MKLGHMDDNNIIDNSLPKWSGYRDVTNKVLHSLYTFTHKKLTFTSPPIVPFWGSSQSGKFFSQILCGLFIRVAVGFGLISNCTVTTQGEADHPCVSDQTECNRSPKPIVIPELCTSTTITRKLFSTQ